ncbi:hypothetical protein Psi01_49550 [Planobispora siamensis]|uniref:Uncharacterized protein n=1 Tax=Planobispora siamensis TaxID=936338 RepID=A0A8J3WM56_9ACTN|nr:hypothetical protein Psi01_49550 [Planobispora siamensis]
MDSQGPAWNPIGSLYAYRALDPVIGLAAAIAGDFADRPIPYSQIPEQIADLLSDFSSRLGNDPDWPAVAERAALSGRVLDGLAVEAAAVRKAAIVFTERGTGAAEPRLRRAAREAVTALQESCERVEGSPMRLADRRLDALFGRARDVLGDPAVAAVFGAAPIHTDGTSSLPPLLGQEMTVLYNAVAATVTRPEFTRLRHQRRMAAFQRVARRGAETFALVMVAKDDESLDAAMESAYGWARALQDIIAGVDVARAWVDRRYLFALQLPERDVLPVNPGGEVELDVPGLQVMAAEGLPHTVTLTIDMEICCSTAGCVSISCQSSGGCACEA